MFFELAKLHGTAPTRTGKGDGEIKRYSAIFDEHDTIS